MDAKLFNDRQRCISSIDSRQDSLIDLLEMRVVLLDHLCDFGHLGANLVEPLVGHRHPGGLRPLVPLESLEAVLQILKCIQPIVRFFGTCRADPCWAKGLAASRTKSIAIS